jgi:hypothetical protein
MNIHGRGRQGRPVEIFTLEDAPERNEKAYRPDKWTSESTSTDELLIQPRLSSQYINDDDVTRVYAHPIPTHSRLSSHVYEAVKVPTQQPCFNASTRARQAGDRHVLRHCSVKYVTNASSRRTSQTMNDALFFWRGLSPLWGKGKQVVRNVEAPMRLCAGLREPRCHFANTDGRATAIARNRKFEWIACTWLEWTTLDACTTDPGRTHLVWRRPAHHLSAIAARFRAGELPFLPFKH